MSFNPVIARLLSTENLTVIQRNVRTAGFDVSSRVLSLPILLPEYEGAYGMLIAHEVGHALYTTQDFNNVFIAATQTMRQYYNVCEDVRVEKLIKRQYPGLRKIMIEGYDIFNKRNFFVPADVNVNSLIFIDRINVHFKCGYSARVVFNDEEALLVKEVECAESVDEVIAVSKKIYELSKKELEEDAGSDSKESKKPNRPDNKDDSDSSGDVSDASDDSDVSDDSDASDSSSAGSNDNSAGDDDTTPDATSDKTDGSSGDDTTESGDATNKSAAEIEKMLESVTDTSLSAGLAQAVNSATTINTFTLETTFDYDPIHSYTSILARCVDSSPCKYTTVAKTLQTNTEQFDKYIARTKFTVLHMFKEFEMRKNAHRQRYAKTSRSGQLDSNKLFAYKIREELFKSISVVADDTNHGMLFLLDWSGSMMNNMHDTLCQMLSLTMFCRKAKIPFRVLAFANKVYNTNGSEITTQIADLCQREVLRKARDNTLLSNAGTGLSLLELFSDKMNEREYTRMAKLVFADVLQSKYSMNATPLNNALVYMHSYIAKYKQVNNIEKLTLVVLSDGESDSLGYAVNASQVHYLREERDTINKIVDPITRNVYTTDRYVTSTLLKMIRDSSNCSVIGFFVCNQSGLSNAISMNYSEYGDRYESAVTNFRKNGYAALTDSSYNVLYLINCYKLSGHEYVPKINGAMNAKSIAAEYVKVNDALLSNKLMMSKVIGEFATGHK